MIKVVKNSEVDRARISHIFTPIDTHLEKFDFSNIVVNKPWGYEYLMYQNDHVSIWMLYLKPGCLTSMHCHLNKKTSLIVLSGEAVCTTLENGFHLKEKDCLVLDKKVFHCTQAVSDQGLILMEVETPSQKTDLLRLSDDYGRESRGYESKDFMSKDIASYEYLSFQKEEFENTKNIRNIFFCLKKLEDEDKITSNIRHDERSLYIILKGNLINKENGDFYKIGDIIDSSLLMGKEKFIANDTIELLQIKKI
ncbi:MAG: hypothetical protein Q7S27_06660 [Nanoarchaeota archaeon]|nr:hypothetical protein [Nanoarchaeota archaeon]